ncbi:Carbohydrate esterase 4 protein [Geranomyces variabilis]|uniref:Carbohydrate esterase 4 protein n=1 Tax=Geranomyces variabilis TaxID=109894 RepID=A0AAD5XKB8_9FUNG|nr:Carbohydrate esterase 4 protein [Geranomyces variabilis]
MSDKKTQAQPRAARAARLEQPQKLITGKRLSLLLGAGVLALAFLATHFQIGTSDGYCGKTSAYCGTGCQSAYGLCTGSAPKAATTTTKAATTSTKAATTSTKPATTSTKAATTTTTTSKAAAPTTTTTTTAPAASVTSPSGGTTTPTGAPQSGRIALAPGTALITQCTVPGTMAWTFDDGPYINEGNIIQQLAAAGMKATFFLNGNNYACIFDADNVARLKALLAGGHQIGHHTWAHPDLATLTDTQINYQMRKLEDAFMKILGFSPRYFRAPYGSITTAATNIINTMGMRHILWDVDSEDANGVTEATAQANIVSGLADGKDMHIILDHETISTTAATIVPWFIKTYGSKFKFVTVAECLGDTANAYMTVPTLDTSTTCIQSDLSGSRMFALVVLACELEFSSDPRILFVPQSQPASNATKASQETQATS